MPNVALQISRHNKKVLQAWMEDREPGPRVGPFCNCSAANRPTCPLPGQCMTMDVVYCATVTRYDTNVTKTYTGCSVCLKTRVLQHRGSFRVRKPDNQTTLSNYIWELQDGGVPYNIRWRIIDRAPPYNPVTGVCRLCTVEKYYILKEPDGAQLNQRDEFFGICHHKRPQLIVNNPKLARR